MEPSSDPVKTPMAQAAPWIALALGAIVLFVGVVFPGGATWGIHMLGRLGTGGAVAGFAVVGIGFVVGLTAKVRGGSGGRVQPALLATVAAIAFAILAWSARVATQLLGDGQLITRDFALVLQGSTDVIESSVSSIVRSDFVSPLTSMLHLASVRIGGDVGALAVESVLLGAAMALVLVFAVMRAPVEGVLKAWATVLVLFSPAALLYFGYVENYAAAHLALGVYAVLALRALGRDGQPVAPTIALLVATGLHVQAVVWWPSAVFLWVGRGRAVVRVPLFVTGVMLVAGLMIAAWVPQKILLGHGGGFSLWSIRHIVDVLQTMWLVFPLLPFAIWLRLRAPSSDPLVFTDLLVGPAIVYLFLIDPILGAARDWDRAAFLSWAFTAQVCVIFADGLRTGRFSKEQLHRWLAPAAAIVAVTSASWVALNHSEARSLERIEEVVTADPHAHEHGFEALTRYHSDREQWADAATWARAAYESSGNPRLATLAAQHMRRSGQPDEALAILETAIERQPADHRVRYELVRAVWETGDYARTLDIAVEGARLHPGESIYPFFAGDCLYRLGRFDEAPAYLERALELGSLPAGSRRHAEQVLAETSATQVGD